MIGNWNDAVKAVRHDSVLEFGTEKGCAHVTYVASHWNSDEESKWQSVVA